MRAGNWICHGSNCCIWSSLAALPTTSMARAENWLEAYARMQRAWTTTAPSVWLSSVAAFLRTSLNSADCDATSRLNSDLCDGVNDVSAMPAPGCISIDAERSSAIPSFARLETICSQICVHPSKRTRACWRMLLLCAVRDGIPSGLVCCPRAACGERFASAPPCPPAVLQAFKKVSDTARQDPVLFYRQQIE